MPRAATETHLGKLGRSVLRPYVIVPARNCGCSAMRGAMLGLRPT